MKGYYSLYHISFPPTTQTSYQRWITTAQLGLYGTMGDEGTEYICGLQIVSVRLESSPDSLKWTLNMGSGDITTKLAYQQLTDKISVTQQWWHSIWTWKALPCVIIFYWLELDNHLLTCNNIQRRGMIGPNICPMYGLEEEVE